MRKLNLGCGPYPMPGYINIDINPRQKPDMVRDVRKGLPFDTASVDEIHASHFLEHLTCDEMLDALEEFHRVLKPGSVLRAVVPLMEFTTLDHKQFFTDESFAILGREDGTYFDRDFHWKIRSKVVNEGGKCREMTVELEAVK